MKTIIILLLLATMGRRSFAQDTIYISRDKITTLFFKSAVKLIGKVPSDLEIKQKDGLITLKATRINFNPEKLMAQDEGNGQVYGILVRYSYGRAGRSILIPGNKMVTSQIQSPVNTYAEIINRLESGKRSNVADSKKTGGVKAWVNKLSLSGNQVFFRLDIRNHSNLPYDIDFVRFYIRDLKTVARMATHEQEIIPVYSSLSKHTTLLKSEQVEKVFAFHRFALSEDQALNIEIYERNGNRHLYLKIRQKDLDHLETINPAPAAIAITANKNVNNNNY